jgi:DNA-binding transcriptional LysR family regulator
MENFRLKVFRVVARHLNFSRAAEELRLTQPAITLQVRALEEELGVPLFDRSGGRIRLTEHGEALVVYAGRLKELADEAFAAVASVSGDHAGSLALGASQTIGQYLLPNLIADFLHEQPRVRISVHSANTDDTIEMLMARHIDLALVEGPAARKDVRMEPFMEDQMVLVVPTGHAWADRQIEVETLRGEPLLMREFGSGSRRFVEKALAKAGITTKSLMIPMEFDSNEGLLGGVEAGLGVTFVSHWAVRNQLRLGTLKLAGIRGLILSRTLSVVCAAGPEPTGAAGAFRLFLLGSARGRAVRRKRKAPRE